MRNVMIFSASLMLVGATSTALAQGGRGGERMPMDKSRCEQMMQGHMGMMGKEHQGMMKDMPKECMEMMGRQGMAGDKGAQAKSHKGVGVVKSVDASAGKVTLQHEPISSLGWPAMTMPFTVQDKSALANLKPGQRVEFDFLQEGSKSVITALK